MTDWVEYSLSPQGIKHVLQETESEKDIGVKFDNELKFENHINLKIKTANTMAGLIRRSYRYLNKETFVPLYKALVRVHFDYATSVWCPYQQGLIDKIEKVQRRATKQLPELKDLEYQERLKSIGTTNPSIYRRIRADMIEVYKIINNIYDQEVSPKLELTSTG